MSDSFVIPWTVACQAPPSMGFSRQEYWSGLPFPSPGDLPDPGIEPESPALAHVFFTTESPEKLIFHSGCFNKIPDDLAASSPRTAGAGSSKLHSLHMHCVRDAFFFGIFVLRDLGASQVVKNLPATAGNTRDSDSIPGSGRSLQGGNGNPHQYSCLENPMDRGTW